MKQTLLRVHILLSLSLLLLTGVSHSVWAQEAFTATYHFSSRTTAVAVDPTPPPIVPGLQFGSFLGSDSIIANAGSGRFNFKNWELNPEISTKRYVEVTIRPYEGSIFTLSSIKFKVQRSSAGAKTYSVRSSIDNFSSNLPASINATTTSSKIVVNDDNSFSYTDLAFTSSGVEGSTITLTDNFKSQSSPITFRIYGWYSNSVNGTFSVDDVIFTGSVTDNAAPTLVELSPANETVNVAASTPLTIHFSEPVKKGNGNIVIKNEDGTVFQTIAASSASVTTAGDSARIILETTLDVDAVYYVEVESGAFTDLSDNPFAGFTGNTTWSFRTQGTSLAFNKTAINFDKVSLQHSTIDSYSISAENLTNNVTITTAAPFSLSKDNTPTSQFLQEIIFSKEELATTKEVFVKFTPTDTITANNKKQITHSSGTLTETVALSGIGTDPYRENFNSCTGALPGFWSEFSVVGDQQWACTTFGRSGNAVQISGFSGSAHENKDWLISPAMDLSNFQYALLSFWSRTKFAGESLALKISQDYDGIGNPEDAQYHWTTIGGRFPAIDSDVWTESKEIDITMFKAPRVYIAFVYTSSASAAPRWTIDDFKVENSANAPAPYLFTTISPLSNFNFGVVASNTTSDAKTFNFSASSLTSDLTITASPNFQVSKNNETFSSTLSYTPEEAYAENTVYVRFAPDAATKSVNGHITFSYHDINNKQGFLTGSTIAEDKTLDIVSWNIEWFGRTTPLEGNTTIPGPADKQKQLENVVRLITTVNADIYALQEISSLEQFRRLVDTLKVAGYKGFISDATSRPEDPESQRVAYIYKASIIDSVTSRPYLQGAYAHFTDADYPTGSASQFWASGRLPFMFEFDATIEGVKKRFNMVNIHAKANESGSGAQVAYDRRVFDTKVLKDSLDHYYPDANIVILGDYNDDVDFTVANISSTTASSYSYLVDAQNFSAVTRTISDAGMRSYISSDNVIDHITVSNELFEEHLANSTSVVIPFDMIENYRNTTSDHMPVATRILFNVTTAAYAANTKVNKVTVYPNPTAGSITIAASNYLEGKNISARLISIDGKQLINVHNTLGNVNEELNSTLKTAKAGLYILQLNIDGETSTVKISKF